MTSVTRVIEVVVSIYSLGLIVYSVLTWLRSPQTARARRWMGSLYDPVLSRIRASVKPVQMAGASLDLSPAILLVGLVILKVLVLNLLPRGW